MISCGLRVLPPKLLVPFNLGVWGCNNWFTVGVYMFLGTITQFWFRAARVGLGLLFMCFIVSLTLGVIGCNVGVSVVVHGFLLSHKHLIHRL